MHATNAAGLLGWWVFWHIPRVMGKRWRSCLASHLTTTCTVTGGTLRCTKGANGQGIACTKVFTMRNHLKETMAGMKGQLGMV